MLPLRLQSDFTGTYQEVSELDPDQVTAAQAALAAAQEARLGPSNFSGISAAIRS